jgi:formyltetrahydrofolate-dependent phosphoribosylglycinamide formyltransferase
VPAPSRRPARVVALASGTGSLVEALVPALRASGRADVVGLVCDQPRAGVIERAGRLGVPHTLLPLQDRARRAAWDGEVAVALRSYDPDLVVSAGFMRLLGPAVLDQHPPRAAAGLPGAHAVRDALTHGVAVTGCTVHLVDAGVDTGPIVAQRAVPVRAGDTEESLHERIKVVERDLLVRTVGRIVTHGYTLTDRKVTLL